MVTKLLLFLAVHGRLTTLSQRTPLGCGEATGAEQLLAPTTTAAANDMTRDMSCSPFAYAWLGFSAHHAGLLDTSKGPLASGWSCKSKPYRYMLPP